MRHEFSGEWITSEEFCGLKPVNVYHRQLDKKEIISKGAKNSHILFRAKFNAEKAGKIFCYISADDYYKLYINGRFVCQGPAPGYEFHYYYNKVDITDFIMNGENVVAVHTYYQGLINRVWLGGDDRHGLIMDIEDEMGNVLLKSDGNFKYELHSGFETTGVIYGLNTQFAERYISGTAQEGFARPDYNDDAWKSAKARKYLDYDLYEQETKQLEFEDIPPVKVSKDEGGVTIDFGAMYVGYLCAGAAGKKGDVIEMLFGQELNPDGSVRYNLRANCDYKEEWVLSGGEDTLDEFDYKVFRYVRLNIPQGCRADNIYLKARHYPFELKAKPNTDDPELLMIWELCVRSLKYGTQEVIHDCMDREKGNYLGDGCYSALCFAILTGDVSIFKKLVDDSLRSSFVNRGLMTCAACSFMQEIAEYPLMLMYAMYSYYELTKDREYLEKHYDSLCDILDFYREEYIQEDGLLSKLDKWCVVEWPKEYRDGYDAEIEENAVVYDVHNVINAHYLGALKTINRIAKCLGREKYCDETEFERAYINAFYVPEKKLFKDNVRSEHISVMSNVFPLMYGFCPDSETEKSIISLIKERGFTSVMLFGAYPILKGLERLGRHDLLISFLKDDGAWKRMLREGATSTFEGWGLDSKKNLSLFHLVMTYPIMFLTDWSDNGNKTSKKINE